MVKRGVIIGLSGRIQSGKTTLADALTKQGYKKISIAEYLKRVVAKLYNIDERLLYNPSFKQKILDTPWKWNKKSAAKLAKIVGLETQDLWDGKYIEFCSSRHALQYIGNEVFRRYDEDFHVKQTLLNLGTDNYVCDDIRYPNELEAFNKYGAYCIYILRPNNFEISNHMSEVALNWSRFKYHIINNKKKSSFIKVLMTFVENIEIEKSGKRRCSLSRKKLILLLKQYKYNTSKVANRLGCSRDKVVWWCKRYLIHLDRCYYRYDHKTFLIPTYKAAYYAGLLSADGCVKRSGKSQTCYMLELSSDDLSLVTGFRRFLNSNKRLYRSKRRSNDKIHKVVSVHSSYIIENLKYWNLEPRKSRRNKIPDIIRDNPALIKAWVVGLIDGDGSIVEYTNRRGFIICILASKEIVEYLSVFFSNIKSCISQEKNIDNLYNLRFHGKYARSLYNDIYQGYGLKRKWQKARKYIEN